MFYLDNKNTFTIETQSPVWHSQHFGTSNLSNKWKPLMLADHETWYKLWLHTFCPMGREGGIL